MDGNRDTNYIRNYVTKKVVIDTSLLISQLISENGLFLKNLVKLQENEFLEFCYSKDSFKELTDTISDNKTNKFLKARLLKVGRFVAWYKYVSKQFPITTNVVICRDPKDNKFLDLLIASQAEFLITLDNDLLEIQTFEKARIVNPSEFLKFVTPK